MIYSEKRFLEECKLLGEKSHDLSSLINIVLRDDLTELYNRRYFRQRLEEERKRVDNDQASLAIIMLDIDDFKLVNDTMGHLKGDEVLVRVGKLISSSVRSIDIVCRYAGDEFVVILPSAGRREAGKIARRIIRSILDFNWESQLGSRKAKIKLSLGYAAYPREARNLEELIQKADMNLYTAKREKYRYPLKRNGKNDYRFFPLWDEASPVPMLERSREMKKLNSLLKKAKRGNPSVLLVEGPDGSGKTRLVTEFLGKQKQEHVITCKGAATMGTTQMPLFPVRESLALLHRNYPSAFQEACSGLEPSSLQQLSKFLPPGILDQYRDDEGSSHRYQVFESISVLIHRLCAILPVIFVIEDLQWADEGTLGFLSFLNENGSQERLLILTTARAGFSPFESPAEEAAEEIETALTEHTLERMSLSNLSVDATGRLIKHVLGMKKIPEKFARDLFRITDGNPIFLKETLVYLVQHDLIEEVVKKGIVYNGASPILPESILEMIEGRFSDLDAPVQRMLQAASVLGYKFQVVYLTALLGEKDVKLYSMLDAAKRENFVREKYVDGVEYFCFDNNLIRDVIYHNMNKRKRKTYHLHIGEVLEEEARLDDAEALERLARHFENGGLSAKACRYLILAGEKARKLFASIESIRYFQRALNVSKALRSGDIDSEELFRVREILGDLLFQVGQMEEARTIYAELLETEDLSSNKKTRITRKMGELYERECKFRRALTFLYKALNACSDQDDPEHQNIVMALSVVFMRKGEVDRALHYSMRILDLPAGRENELLTAKVFFIIGSCYLSKGQAKTALSFFRKSLKIREKSDNLIDIGYTYLNIGNALYRSSKRKRAQDYWKKAVKIGQKTSNAFLEMAARNNATICFYDRDDPDSIITSLVEVHRLARKMGNMSGVASCKNNLGAIHREVGRLDRAIIEFEKCLEISEKMDNFDLIAKATINLGIVHCDIGDLTRAENYAWKTLELTTKNKMKLEEGKSWELLGDVNYQRGNYPWALDCYQRASNCFEGLNESQNGEKSLLHLKILESLCLSDDSHAWKQNLTNGLSLINGRKSDIISQIRIRKAVIYLNKGQNLKEATSLLQKVVATLGEQSPRLLDLWQAASLLTRCCVATSSFEEASEAARIADSTLRRIRTNNKSKSILKTFMDREDVKEFSRLKKKHKLRK